jgi:dihydropteroate synthase
MIYKLSNETDINGLFAQIECDKGGIAIMRKKARQNLFYIRELSVKAANILKQDALSIGAELATSRHTCDFSKETTDAVLICNDKQLEILAKKELAQPFGLKVVAKELADFISPKKFAPRLMGVLNINSDSFYSGSRVCEDEFLDKAMRMIDDGADIIDIGGVSSRPGSVYCGEAEEMDRTRGVIEVIGKHKLHEKAIFSVDSFSPLVICLALDNGFRIVNDITGLENDEVAELTARYDASVIIMHKQGDTVSMQDAPGYNDVMLEVDQFFAQRISRAHSFGIRDIILDIGIGFGKTLAHNLLLIRNLEHFTHFGYELLVGASRKSMISSIAPCEVEDRLAGTLTLHQKALDNGASILRAHDVKEHTQMLAVWTALKNYTSTAKIG